MKDDSASILFLISAPSGAGKTTVCQNLLAANQRLVRAITCTTRPPRGGEVDGKDYYFLDRETFARRIAAGEFLEHAEVYGNLYGTLSGEVNRLLGKGNHVLLNIDVQGAALIRERAKQDPALASALVTVFLTPGEWSELERRLRTRGSDDEAVIAGRLQAAARELVASVDFDYLVLSGTMDEDRERMEKILEVEGMRRGRHNLPEALTKPANRLSET